MISLPARLTQLLEDRRIIVGAAASAAVAIGYLTFQFIFRAPDGDAHKSPDQKALLAPGAITGVPNVTPITAATCSRAADTLAVSNFDDPMLVACGAAVRTCVCSASEFFGRARSV